MIKIDRKKCRNKSFDFNSSKPSLLKKSEIKELETNISRNLKWKENNQNKLQTHIYLDEKSRLIPNETNLLTQLSSVWI